MIVIDLVCEGNGRFRTASKEAFVSATAAFVQGEVVSARVGKKRSGPQHRWFFAMVAHAFENQSAGPSFVDEERLRKWLLIKVGHCNEQRFEPRAMTREVAAWLRQTYTDIDIATDGTSIIVRTARSISHRSCTHDEMCRIADAVIDVICEQIVPGTTRADWEPMTPARRKKAVEAKAA